MAATSKIPEQQWQGLFNGRVAAECVQCGIKVTGEELRQLSLLDLKHPIDDPKLDRLRLNYCARNSCQSRLYLVHIESDSELHWTAIKEQLQLATPEVREKKQRKPISIPSFSLPRVNGLTVSIAVLCVFGLFFLLRYWVFGYRIPIVQKKNEYRVIQAPE